MCVPILLRPRDPAAAVSLRPAWELAMLIIIQANHRALMLNALANRHVVVSLARFCWEHSEFKRLTTTALLGGRC